MIKWLSLLSRGSAKRLNRVTLTLVFLSIAMSLTAPRVNAYDDDTHFWLTYYLARKVGYTPLQALQIASADISVDYDPQTWPVLPHSFSLQGQRKKFHAFPSTKQAKHCRKKVRKEMGKDKNSSLTLDERKQMESGVYQCLKPELDMQEAQRWDDALRTGNPGVFLHYYQDRFAHRGFESRVGHLRAAHVPDFLSSDSEKAKLMAKETVRMLRRFMSEYFKNATTPAEPDSASIERAVEEFVAANPSSLKMSEIYDEFDWNSTNVNVCKVYGGQDCANRKPTAGDLIRLLTKLSALPPANSFKAYEIVNREFPGEVTQIWMYDLKKNGLPPKTVTARAYWYVNDRLVLIPNSKAETKPWRLGD
jgi:hypothetical protein